MSYILFGERDPSLAEDFHEFLCMCGYKVELAATALECLRFLRNSVPDALVVASDLPWGGTDGLLSVMQSDAIFQKIPVVFVGRDGLTDPMPPVFAYVEKPCRMARLVRLLKQFGHPEGCDHDRIGAESQGVRADYGHLLSTE